MEKITIKEVINRLQTPGAILSVVGSLKLILSTFGLNIPGTQVNDAVNVVSLAVTVIGIVLNHGTLAPDTPETPTTSILETIAKEAPAIAATLAAPVVAQTPTPTPAPVDSTPPKPTGV